MILKISIVVQLITLTYLVIHIHSTVQRKLITLQLTTAKRCVSVVSFKMVGQKPMLTFQLFTQAFILAVKISGTLSFVLCLSLKLMFSLPLLLLLRTSWTGERRTSFRSRGSGRYRDQAERWVILQEVFVITITFLWLFLFGTVRL